METPLYPQQNNFEQPTAEPAPIKVERPARRRVFLLLMAFGLLIVVAAVAYWYFNRSYNIQPITSDNPSQTSGSQVLPSDADGDRLNDDEEKAAGTNPEDADTDDDGVIDSDEVKLFKTSPLETDTDNDGLSDGEEAYTWRSDPLQKDSDSDGYSDGDEVGKGFNPMGDGILPQGY